MENKVLPVILSMMRVAIWICLKGSLKMSQERNILPSATTSNHGREFSSRNRKTENYVMLYKKMDVFSIFLSLFSVSLGVANLCRTPILRCKSISPPSSFVACFTRSCSFYPRSCSPGSAKKETSAQLANLNGVLFGIGQRTKCKW